MLSNIVNLAAVGLFGIVDFAPSLLILAAAQLLAPRWGEVRAAEYAALLYLWRNVVYPAAAFPVGVLADGLEHGRVLTIGYARGRLGRRLIAGRWTTMGHIIHRTGARVWPERRWPRCDNGIMAPLDWIGPELTALRTAGLLRSRRAVEPLSFGRCRLGGRVLLDFAGNDYLDLAQHPHVIEAAIGAARCSGVGATASALVVGRTVWHAELEDKLADFEGQPAALLFPTGFAANLGVVTSLAGHHDVVLGDRRNHASLIDGCRLSGASFRTYPHGNLAFLEQLLQRSASARRRLIVTDGVFSMDGDLAPLPELCDLAARHDACLIIDEAHGTGVHGERGRGASEHWHVEDRVHVRVGTLSKALGSLGGFVTGSAELIEWLWNRARPQIYSTALPPLACAAAGAALEILRAEPERRVHLANLGRQLRARLREAGLEVSSTEGPIVPVVLQQTERVMRVAERLEALGFVVGAIRPPSVPPGTARLRITLSAGHTSQDVADLGDAVAAAVRETAPARDVAMRESGPAPALSDEVSGRSARRGG